MLKVFEDAKWHSWCQQPDVGWIHCPESNEWQTRSKPFFVAGRPPLKDVDWPCCRNFILRHSCQFFLSFKSLCMRSTMVPKMSTGYTVPETTWETDPRFSPAHPVGHPLEDVDWICLRQWIPRFCVFDGLILCGAHWPFMWTFSDEPSMSQGLGLTLTHEANKVGSNVLIGFRFNP